MNIIKIAAVSTLALMTVFNPIASASSHHHHHSSSVETPTKENTKIKVDTKHNKITLYKKVNGKWKKVKSEKCATGKKGKTTKGKYKTKSKKKSFSSHGKDYNYVTYFDGDKAIHSTPYDGKYDNSSLGHSRSNGCVRVKPETAKWIYENVEKGTTIEVN